MCVARNTIKLYQKVKSCAQAAPGECYKCYTMEGREEKAAGADPTVIDHNGSEGRKSPFLPPPPASWPATQGKSSVENGKNNTATAVRLSPAVADLVSQGFDEEIAVDLPDRQAKYFVRLAGRELAATGGITVALHGGGFTGMSWAPVAGIIKRDCCVLAPDLRGHGLTTSSGDGMLSLESLTEDMLSLLKTMFSNGMLIGSRPAKEQPPTEDSGVSSPTAAVESEQTASIATEQYDVEKSPTGSSQATGGLIDGNKASHTFKNKASDMCAKVLLVGHSLGGSIAVRVAAAAEELKRRCDGAADVGGVIAVDVVEGTALAALEDMPEILRKIPATFSSVEEAVMWHVKTGAVRSAASASVVVPSRLRDDGAGTGVVWRTDLRATEQHWRGWFEGLSSAFLALPVPKLLVVAGMDRLDTDLTAAHMQGRFQLKMVYGCGHSIQEDQPGETANTIMSFALRHSILRRSKSGAASGANPSDEEKLRQKLARARGYR